MFWNKELTILLRFGVPATCTVAMQHSFFLHRSRALRSLNRRLKRMEKNLPKGPRAYKAYREIR